MIRRPPRSTQSRSSAASDVYKRQPYTPRPAGDAQRPPYTPRPQGDGQRPPYTPRPQGDGQRPPYTPRPQGDAQRPPYTPVSYTHLRAHETRHDLVCRLLLEKKQIHSRQIAS